MNTWLMIPMTDVFCPEKTRILALISSHRNFSKHQSLLSSDILDKCEKGVQDLFLFSPWLFFHMWTGEWLHLEDFFSPNMDDYNLETEIINLLNGG